MHDGSLDTPSHDPLPCAPVADPVPHISGKRALTTKAAVRPRFEDLAREAQHRGVDISSEMAAAQRTIDRMKAKVGIPASRPLRVI